MRTSGTANYWSRSAARFRRLRSTSRRAQYFVLHGSEEAILFDAEAMVTLAESFDLLITVITVPTEGNQMQAAVTVSGLAANLADFFETWDGICADAH